MIPDPSLWKYGRDDSFRFMEVVGGNDVRQLEGISGGKITRNVLSELKHSGSFNYSGVVDSGWIDKVIRVYLDVRFKVDPSVLYSVMLGTFLTTTPSRKIHRSSSEYEIQGYGLLIKLKRKHPVGIVSFPVGTNVVDTVVSMCREVGLLVRYTPSDYVLTSPYTSKDEDTYLTICNALLSRANYSSVMLGVDGAAIITPYVEVKDKAPSWVFEDSDEGVYLPDITVDWDVFDVPNEFIIVASDSENSRTVVVRNEDPDDVLSIPNRGVISTTVRLDYYDTAENLRAYGNRLIAGYRESIENYKFQHWYVPVFEGDTVIFRNKNVEGDQTVSIHTMDILLEPGVLIDTKVRKYRSSVKEG